MIEEMSIPGERKAILIGCSGKVKTNIEKKTSTKITIKDAIEIQGEPVNAMKAREIIKAIGRGFSPSIAFKLMDDDMQLSVISLKSETPKKMKRLLSRVIGRDGSAKKKIEELTGCSVSIYGKTVSLLGAWKETGKARKAVEELLSGAPHAHVYRGLLQD